MKRGKVLIFTIWLFSIILFSSFASAINTCPTGYQVVRGGSVSINCYPSLCAAGAIVKYSGSSLGIFVPTKTQAEWTAFISRYSSVSGTSYTCCVQYWSCGVYEACSSYQHCDGISHSPTLVTDCSGRVGSSTTYSWTQCCESGFFGRGCN